METPYNQLKEHLEACLTKYNDLDSALGPFFLINFCFLQVSDKIIFDDCSMYIFDQVNMILSLYLSLTGLLQDRETIVCCQITSSVIGLFIMFECEKQVEQYGSQTLMGIVSISLLVLALSGPCHLFNSVSWVENLQSRST